MRELTAGVLIIGSLLWEPDAIRQRWRDQRLNLEAKQQVRTQTRYGRISSSRKCTYTMVFSRSAAPSTAIVVPFRNTIRSLDDLLVEAQHLAAAEGLGNKTQWRSFGAVGLLPHPDSRPAKRILSRWTSFFRDYLNNASEATRKAGKGEEPSLRSDGILNAAWPICTEVERPNDCDLLLATANAPDLNDDGSYPTAEQIAQRWLDEHYIKYFSNNVRNRIFTADDPAIWAVIREARPTWIHSEEFDSLDAAVAGSTRNG